MASHPENRPEPMSDIQPTTYQDAIASTNDVITSSQAPPQKKTKKVHDSTHQNTPLPSLTTVRNEKSGDSSLPPVEFTMTSPVHTITTTVGITQTTTTPGSLPNTTTVGNEKITPSPDPVPDLPTSDLPKTVTETQTNTNPAWENNTNPAWENNPWYQKPLPQLPPINTDTDLMDTESNATIEPNEADPQPPALYSQIHKRRRKPAPRPDDEWYTATLKAKANRRTTEIDRQTWNYENIIKALDSPEELKKFFVHKLQHKPSKINIPEAINQKITYLDTAFFRSFSRSKDTAPQHQREFESLFEMSLEKYRRFHNVKFINKSNRQQIYDKLRTKIALDYICNLDFIPLKPHDCTRRLFYCINLAKLIPKVTFEQARTLLFAAHDLTREPLPEEPSSINLDFLAALPQPLPLTNRKHIRVTVSALRKIYNFEQLPDTYFDLPNTPLPERLEDLHPAVRDLFPITDWSTLKRLSEYRQQLQNYYKLEEKIPPQYFELPAGKEKLPHTPQALNSATRHLFPCAPQSEEEFKQLITTLREHYSFKRLPSDYFKHRRKLPSDPTSIETKLTFTFPISDTQLAIEFLNEIKDRYQFNIPLPLHYMTCNPTDKPTLPAKHEDVTLCNITIPIRSPRILVSTARLLRQFYFFHKIPDAWIDITNFGKNDKPTLPADITEANNILSSTKSCQHIELPITDYAQIIPTIQTLRQSFRFRSFPTNFINVPDLPGPTWEMVDNYAPLS